MNDDFDLSDARHPFDVAIASSLFRRLSLNSIARALVSVIRALGPDGRFYATWPDSPDPVGLDPIVQADGSTTYCDHEPFHYSFGVLAAIVEAVGGRAECLDERTHPRGETIMLITRRTNA